MRSTRDWLALHWVAGALFMAAGLMLLVPLLARVWSLPLLLIFLHIPAYMAHQVEEHAGDRFRRFINARIFAGREALTTNAVLWINLPGVWGVTGLALYAAALIGPGAGLCAAYLVLVNGVSHIATVLRTRSYNPGLATAGVLFIPIGVVTLREVPASAAAHAVGLAVSLAIHGAIIIHVGRRAARLRS